MFCLLSSYCTHLALHFPLFHFPSLSALFPFLPLCLPLLFGSFLVSFLLHRLLSARSFLPTLGLLRGEEQLCVASLEGSLEEADFQGLF